MLRFPARGTECPFGTRRATSSRRGAERLEGPWTEVDDGDGGGRGATALPARFFKEVVELP